jgi:hypothetical protein
MRVAFDSTVDEVADVNMLLAQHTTTFRRQRAWVQMMAGGCFSAAVIGTVLFKEQPPFTTLAIVIGVAIAGGFLFGYMYGLFQDWNIRQNYRRLVNELFSGAQTMHCEFELRSDVLWCKTPSNEISFPWSRLTRLEETERGIELWFNPGLAVVRNRAFASDGERQRFVEAATKLSRENRSE